MVGGGLSLVNYASDVGWRAGLGVAGHLLVSSSGRHRLSVELWGALGSWDAFVFDYDGVEGEWSVMPSAHVHMSYRVRATEHLEFRVFGGVMTNFGFDPDNANVCEAGCEGPVLAPSIGLSLGYIL